MLHFPLTPGSLDFPEHLTRDEHGSSVAAVGCLFLFRVECALVHMDTGAVRFQCHG